MSNLLMICLLLLFYELFLLIKCAFHHLADRRSQLLWSWLSFGGTTLKRNS